jgi:hypothetical protein
MNRRIKFLLVFLVLLLCYLLTTESCKKPNSNYTANYQYNYYPLDSGHYVIYNVDSVYFNENYVRDTVTYQWRVTIGDTFYDNMNRLNRKLVIYRRGDSTQAWTFDRQWYALLTTTNLQVNEDDLRFIKLVFPPSLGETWNGNLYISTTNLPPNDPYLIFTGWNYYYENTDTALNINGNNLSNVMVVSEVDNVSFINKTVRTEMYAPNIGLVYEEWIGLSTGGSSVVTPQFGWDTAATSGFSIHMWLVGYNP